MEEKEIPIVKQDIDQVMHHLCQQRPLPMYDTERHRFLNDQMNANAKIKIVSKAGYEVEILAFRKKEDK